MKSEIIARRYAEGFFSFAKESLSPEQILTELKGLKAVLRESPGFRIFLESPGIFSSDKGKVIENGFKESLSIQLKSFLLFLIQKKRVNLLSMIIDHLRVKYSRQDELNVLVQVSSPMDLDFLKLIAEKLETKFHRRLKMFIHLDPDLLGGMRVRVGNTVMDGSLLGALSVLRERLQAVKIY